MTDFIIPPSNLSNILKYQPTSSVKATDFVSDSSTNFINIDRAWPLCILVDGLGVAAASASCDKFKPLGVDFCT